MSVTFETILEKVRARPNAVDFSSICMQCLRGPRMPGRKLCHECKKTVQRERWRAHQRRKKLDKINPDLCNCGDPVCKGFCNVVRL